MVGSTSYVAVNLTARGQRSGRCRRSRTPDRKLVTNPPMWRSLMGSTFTSTTAPNPPVDTSWLTRARRHHDGGAVVPWIPGAAGGDAGGVGACPRDAGRHRRPPDH